ncbi:class I SAM-dependent methyltransferase [Planomicrobium sp. CPCC 101110]|uniref:class I SAM-dependent methyltransferase n=1 Tax=Planomicrobium sp. CPCC 101110 TaxID=2599619 RepID=UPI0011B3D26D|nr:class I SAM-dependent methyltransferase [Planomicrobium sp. CPCC 101110]TWT25885.1 class I SAM-dependent methyltransferase [Planomicrobium sp. CPCC 101110]
MGKLFPHIYDRAMAPLEHKRFKKIRAALISNATGKVLEIGSGTGANFPHYRFVDQVDAIEPDPVMMRQSEKRQKAAKVPIQTYLAKAEKLPFEDGTFDSVVGTLVFCTIPEPKKALQEIRRVSKSGGKLLLFEHVRLEHKSLGKAQDLFTPIWKNMCDGCHLNRETLQLLEQSGIEIKKVEKHFNGLFLTIECSL